MKIIFFHLVDIYSWCSGAMDDGRGWSMLQDMLRAEAVCARRSQSL